MKLDKRAITVTNDLPIIHQGEVHDGKVRSVYWLTDADSGRISNEYFGIGPVDLGVMVISDRISAFECKWTSKSGLKGVPGKGAALNAISSHWFDEFEVEGLAGHHIVATPHPLAWIVRKAEPIMIEAIARQYLTGSMWRDYKNGQREFGGAMMPDGLKEHQKLDQILITPSTKGIIKGVPGVPELDDVNITRKQITDNHLAFGFKRPSDVDIYESLLTEGFKMISLRLAGVNEILVDTKFEFGYVTGRDGFVRMIYQDEVGTPDSSRYWDRNKYHNGQVVENSKELFRKRLLDAVPDRDVLLNKNRMEERVALAEQFRVPDSVFMETSDLYKGLAEKITGKPVPEIIDARAEIIDALQPYGIIR
jgi:phosphoribosylaminoimidazole-succinocarboxamide synthase